MAAAAGEVEKLPSDPTYLYAISVAYFGEM
jgi:hypothetical protein